MEDRSSRRMRTLVTQMAHRGLSAKKNACALISMMARSTNRSNQRPDTLMQDRKPTDRRNPLATHGRTTHWVESGCDAVAVGRTYLFPPLSSGGALVVRPWLRFHIPLIEPDRQLSRIRLPDKTSRFHPRHVVPKRGQAYEPEVPVKMREWIGPALASPDVVLDAQPPAQPHSGVVVERPVRFIDGANFEVVRPSAQRAVQLEHQLCGLLPCPRSDGQRVDVFHHTLDALLRWPVPQARLAGSR